MNREGGTGRRRASSNGRRARSVLVRLSDDELARLRIQAAEAGFTSLPHFLLDAAQSRATGESLVHRQQMLAVLATAMRDLAKVGGNLNQIAHHANTGGVVGDDARATFREARECARRMAAAFDRIASSTRAYNGSGV